MIANTILGNFWAQSVELIRKQVPYLGREGPRALVDVAEELDAQRCVLAAWGARWRGQMQAIQIEGDTNQEVETRVFAIV